MNFWNKVKQMVEPKQEVKAINVNSNFNDWPDNSTGGDPLISNEEVFSVITRLSNMLSSLPIHLYKNYSEVNNETSSLLSVEANESISAFQLFNITETARNTDGNGYIFIERDKYGSPIRLYPLPPKNVSVMRDTDTDTIWYRVDYNQFHFLIFNTEMIHVKHTSPNGVYVGISPLDVLRDSLKFQDAVEDFSLGEMKKKDKFIIQYDRSMDEPKIQSFLQQFRDLALKNGGAIIQQAGFKVERYASSFQPTDLNTTEALARTRIANAFNVPLSFLNDGQAKATTNPEHVMTQFVQMTLIPIVRQYESEFNRKLLTRSQRMQGYYFKFNINGLLRGDTAARTQFYQMMIRNGIATPNELRKLEDLPVSNEPNADKLWFSGDLYPLNLAEQRNTLKGGGTNEENQSVSDD